MKIVKQLLRQPLKTLVGIALMTLAAAILCICVGQAIAAQSTRAELDRRFSAVAIPIVQEDLDGNTSRNSFLLEDELLTWLEKTAARYPGIIKQIAHHGILSACIPEMTPLNMTAGGIESATGEFGPKPYAMPYTCAMLVLTLDEIGQIEVGKSSYPVENLSREDFASDSDYIYWLYVDPDTEKVTVDSYYYLEISGTVTEVISLADGYRDPVGRIARLRFIAPTLEELEAVELVPGERYVVYGMDYVDEHWELISRKNVNGGYDHMDLENFDPGKFRFLTDQEREKYQAYAQLRPNMEYMASWVAVYDGIFLSDNECKELNAISLTLEQPVSAVTYEEVRCEETGRLLELVAKTNVSYTDENGETVTVSFDEYNQRYQIPTIAKLDGSVEDFLNSEQGSSWKEALQIAAVNNQAFAVIGVDRMDYLADFSLQRSRIVEGRDFTEEERIGGSRVCIIHESVAEASGLKVGDTVTLNLYSTDYGMPYQRSRNDGFGILNPSASYYFSTTPMEETAEYTIVGLWKGQSVWAYTDNEYAFSPNTVFVPHSSVQAEMETCGSVLFHTVALQNGKIAEFHDLAIKSGYAGRFRYNDQDYDTIAVNFHNYESLAKQMLTIGIVVYAALLLLFLLLYPAGQKATAKTMRSLGAGFFLRFQYVMASTMGIVIPASVLGGWIGIHLWDSLVIRLQAAAESAVALQIEPGTLTRICVEQMIFTMILTTCVSLLVAAPRGIPTRR